MSEANKEIIRRYQEAYNSNNLDVLDELLAPDWKTNGWVQGVPQTIDSAKDVYQSVLQAFPDVQWHTLDLLADGDWVIQRTLMRGTFKGEIAGLQPTGEVVDCGGISMWRIAEGKIVEHWGYADDAGFWARVGLDVPEVMLAFSHGSPEELTL
jgi:predicted ester cyclase